MSAAPRQPVADFLPDNAPFTPDQRAWLNGLFAGLTALDDGSIKALSEDESAGLMAASTAVEDDDEALKIGLDEYLDGDGVCVIEWADKFPDLLPAHTQWLRFSHREDGARVIEHSAA